MIKGPTDSTSMKLSGFLCDRAHSRAVLSSLCELALNLGASKPRHRTFSNDHLPTPLA